MLPPSSPTRLPKHANAHCLRIHCQYKSLGMQRAARFESSGSFGIFSSGNPLEINFNKFQHFACHFDPLLRYKNWFLVLLRTDFAPRQEPIPAPKSWKLLKNYSLVHEQIRTPFILNLAMEISQVHDKARAKRLLPHLHFGFFWRAIPFLGIATLAGCDQIVPSITTTS